MDNSIIQPVDVDDVREFWVKYGPIEGTEVVELLDHQGVRSILIKETKNQLEKRSKRQNPEL